VRAALAGDSALAADALARNPLVASRELADRLTAALLPA
jgi:alpha-galactosidase/6-phospho-beta-glucosidase family protein